MKRSSRLDHGNEVYELAFSRDGRTLASGSFDRTAVVRDGRPIVPPDTAGWDLLLGDDFSISAVADRYYIYDDSWAVQSGAAVGTTVQRPVEAQGFLSALMVPKVLLPATVEVEFDARSDVPVNLEVKFHDERFRPRHGLGVVMLGRKDSGFHAGDTGATVLWRRAGPTARSPPRCGTRSSRASPTTSGSSASRGGSRCTWTGRRSSPPSCST
ncbi:MAG: WD40 repeat domain-containing protein [Isosphaeraceae bacterium]